MKTFFRTLVVILVVFALVSGHVSSDESRCSCGTAFAQDVGASATIPVSPVIASAATVATDTTATPPVVVPQAVQGPLPKLVDLGAGKCIPCKKMAPILEEAKKLYAGLAEVVFIDVWENPDEKAKYGIRMIPTQIFYDASGTEVFRHEGFFPMEDIQKQFETMGVVLKKQ